ncbi:MAG: cupin domain-containing protein [Halanaerobiaceae bacterium]
MIIKNEDVESEKLDEKLSRKILCSKDSLMLVEVSFKKGGIGEVHSHSEHEQVSYIKKGSFEVTVEGEKKILEVGDSFYAGKNIEHGVRALEDAVILDVFTPPREEFLK